MISTLKVNIPKSIGGGFITLSINADQRDISVQSFKEKALDKVIKNKLQTNLCGNVFLDPNKFKVRIVSDGDDMNKLAKEHLKDLNDTDFTFALNKERNLTLALFQISEQKKQAAEIILNGIQTYHNNYIVPGILDNVVSGVVAGDNTSKWTISMHHNNENKYVYLKDYTGRYLTANHQGAVYLQKTKGTWCEWLLEKEHDKSYIMDKHGKYLTVNLSNDVYCDAKGEWGKFKFSRTILEGPLKKKSSSSIGRQWLSRYFRLHNKTLQYWKTKEEAHHTTRNQAKRCRSLSASRKKHTRRHSYTKNSLILPPSTPSKNSRFLPSTPSRNSRLIPRSPRSPRSTRSISIGRSPRREQKKSNNSWNIENIEKVIREDGCFHRFKIEFKNGQELTLEASSDRERDVWVNVLRGEQSPQIVPENFLCNRQEIETKKNKNLKLPVSFNFDDLNSPMGISKKQVSNLEPMQAVECLSKQRERARTINKQSKEEQLQLVNQLSRKENRLAELKKQLIEISMEFKKEEEEIKKAIAQREENSGNKEILKEIKNRKNIVEKLQAENLNSSWKVYFQKYQKLSEDMKASHAEEEEKAKKLQKLKNEERVVNKIEADIDQKAEFLNQNIAKYNRTCKMINNRIMTESKDHEKWMASYEVKKKQLKHRWASLGKRKKLVSATSNNVFDLNPTNYATTRTTTRTTIITNTADVHTTVRTTTNTNTANTYVTTRTTTINNTASIHTTTQTTTRTKSNTVPTTNNTMDVNTTTTNTISVAIHNVPSSTSIKNIPITDVPAKHIINTTSNHSKFACVG